MVEGARLERVYTGNRIEGSNPSLSASIIPLLRYHVQVAITEQYMALAAHSRRCAGGLFSCEIGMLFSWNARGKNGRA